MRNTVIACGKPAHTNRQILGKKCVRQSPNHTVLLPHPLFVWNTPLFIPSFTLVLSLVVSTSQHAKFTSVIYQVLPTFHTTYNHHNQFI